MTDWAGRFNKKYGYNTAIAVAGLLFVTKCKEAQTQLAAGNHFSPWLMAAIENNREGISKMRVTHYDRRASVFVIEELEPFKGSSQGSFHVRLTAKMCDCSLFQYLHFPFRHALAACAAAICSDVHAESCVQTI
ncbi:hypothetical protein Ahy_A04g017915 [Arachis hypogaea]|uniref:Zinc finger PMZ-type domain-containing protein n=1 Tax=Arachis hypogaea TaxID=3818 RepID=A0A445DCD6_ARAHY|nr:hypothetical protein Ahy_A04g017915 [Arachis hypogaea]